MKRKFVIALVAQTVLILILFTFALIQKAEADKQTELAVEQARRAEQERANTENIRLPGSEEDDLYDVRPGK
jgi:hypothetical protein